MEKAHLEVRQVTPALKKGLEDLFSALRAAGDEKWFHPHALNIEILEWLTHYKGKDLYYAMAEGEAVLAYGMLRGWDEGYEIPSLGIAVHPRVRRKGLAAAFLHFLHAAARRRGAKAVRLTVDGDNVAALTLYKNMGYQFKIEDLNRSVGMKYLE
jgi:[ribosomal protein S18]-alanine N-acetyltransferase